MGSLKSKVVSLPSSLWLSVTAFKGCINSLDCINTEHIPETCYVSPGGRRMLPRAVFLPVLL